METKDFVVLAVNFMFDTKFTDETTALAYIQQFDYKTFSKVMDLAKMFNDVYLKGAEYALNRIKVDTDKWLKQVFG